MFGSHDRRACTLQGGQQGIEFCRQVHVFFSPALGQEFQHTIVLCGRWDSTRIHEFSDHGHVLGFVLILFGMDRFFAPGVVLRFLARVSRAFITRVVRFVFVSFPFVHWFDPCVSFVFAQHDGEGFRPVGIEQSLSCCLSLIFRWFGLASVSWGLGVVWRRLDGPTEGVHDSDLLFPFHLPLPRPRVVSRVWVGLPPLGSIGGAFGGMKTDRGGTHPTHTHTHTERDRGSTRMGGGGTERGGWGGRGGR
eukprot:scaffold826_cov335-Pavlova_lutheri.AAC.15